MQKTCSLARPFTLAARRTSNPPSTNIAATPWTPDSPIVTCSEISIATIIYTPDSSRYFHSRLRNTAIIRSIIQGSGRSIASSQPLARPQVGKIWPNRTQHPTAASYTEYASSKLNGSPRMILEPIETEVDSQHSPQDLRSWERLFAKQRREYGDDGGWAVFESMQEKGLLKLMTLPQADGLREGTLEVAFNSSMRIFILIEIAHQLLAEANFLWPNLYLKIMHHSLGRAHYKQAIRWHILLGRRFLPKTDIFWIMISSFAADPQPKMQNTLKVLYLNYPERNAYDCIIPALFTSGRSDLARKWRKILVLFEDFPTTLRSRSFLEFIKKFYPGIRLIPQELSILKYESSESEIDAGSEGDPLTMSLGDAPADSCSDSSVAEWLARPWISSDFVIKLVDCLNLRVIGPWSLRALALRETETQGVMRRVSQLERLGIQISTKAYCQALVSFAKHGDISLLRDLLNWNIHPDNLDDPAARQKMIASIRRTDWRRRRLLLNIERVVGSGDLSFLRLNTLLRSELSIGRMSKVRLILDRMTALRIQVTQKNAERVLARAFSGLCEHPSEWARLRETSTSDQNLLLNEAIDHIRLIASHNIAIPLRYWRLLIYVLGRLGRFDELERLCLEVVEFYTLPVGGLLSVHEEDWICSAERCSDDNKNTRQDTRDRRACTCRVTASPPDTTKYIPTDFPFSHREHPIQKLFDPSLQRRIVRWGFDQTLASPPYSPKLMGKHPTGLRRFDVACGVRLLAILRDRGVLIDTQKVRVAVASRIAVSQVPGRKRHRSRDQNEMSVDRIKELVDNAWGSELLAKPAELFDEVEKQQAKVFHRYSRPLIKAFDETLCIC